MGSKKVFTKMDLRWGFNNVRIKKEDEWKGVFTIHIGSFESIVMFFGMKNLPVIFQTMMNKILRDLINKGKVAAFVDNVLVGTETEEGHNEIVNEIPKRLEENDLYVKLEKCVQKVRKIVFLGVVIGSNGIEMEKEKVDRVLSQPEPKNVKSVRNFLGLINYYRRFIKDFAQVARPINILTKKDMKWQQGQEQQKAFDELKRIFTTKLVLATLDLDKEFRVEADTSNYATGGVLSMKCSDELWRPVAFISKSLSDIERNYEIHDKKMLVRCLEAQRHFLEGMIMKFEIWTNHKNLEYFIKVQKLNYRQVRWALYLSRFDFTLKHVLGSRMGKADSLSRRPDWEVGVERDNENKTLVKPEQLEVRRMEKIEIIVEGVDLLKEVKQSKVKDNEVVKIVEEIKQAGVKMLRDEEWREVDDIMYKERKVYIPKDDKLRAEIIRLHHDMPVGGHRGQWKTVELVTHNFWQPEVTKKVKQYVKGYDSCQGNKNLTEQPVGKLMPNSIPERSWMHISADFITKLPLAQGYNSILVVVDRLTKIVHFISTTEKMSAEGLTRLFRDNVWKLHGLPESIISDRGSQFVAGMMRELNQMLEIESKLLMVFHP